MSDDDLERDDVDEAIATMPDLARMMAAFTANCEQRGYTRAEAIALTGEWLRAMILGSKG